MEERRASARITKDEVVHMSLRPGMTIDELVREMEKAGCLGAGRLAEAVNIYEEMLREGATVFFGLAGPLIPAGFRRLISDMIRRKMIHVLVSTGANIVHDLLELFGGHHYRGTYNVDDRALYERGIDRIYDVFVPESHFREHFDKGLLPILEDIAKHRKDPIGIREFLEEIAKRLPPDEDCVLYTAYKYGVPVYVPAIQDSCFSLIERITPIGEREHVPFEDLGIQVDTFKDVASFLDLNAKAEKRGAVLIGGGVPKNFILQSAIVVGRKPFDYVVQITMDRPEPGGLSGATLEEAISWGKVGTKAKTVQVIGDAIIYLPIIVAAVLERLEKR